MSVCRAALILMTVFGLSACGGSPSAPSGTGGASTSGNPAPAPPTGGESGTPGGTTLQNGSMSATIDGVRWAASRAIVASNRILPDGTPHFVLTGGDGVHLVLISLIPRGPGTYLIETRAVLTLSVSTVQQPVQAWVAERSSSLPGGGLGTGTVTLSTITANRAVGTFSFTAEAAPMTAATGRRVVTNGTFDVTF